MFPPAEATTLGFVEIFLAARLRHERAASGLALVYAEPSDYRTPPRPSAMHRRDFELSDEVRNFTGVPGATFLLEDDVPTRAAFLVGYEGQRLEQALEQNAIRPSDSGVIFGVPAFQPGWEMNSFANNIRIIRERDIPTVMYAGAQNPSSAMRALREFRRAAPDTRLLIGAIGTKPHGIAAALFACEYPDVGLIYDHPTRQHGRSSEVATWHLFDVRFDPPA